MSACEVLVETTQENWYTPHRVRLLYRLMPYYIERAPRLSRFEDVVVPSGGYRNVNEWWWAERGRLMWALDQLDARSSRIIRLCLILDLNQDHVAGIMSLSQQHVSRLLREACEDAATALGWREDCP